VAGQFRVEPAGLTAAGGRLSACSDALGAVDLPGPLSAAAGALPGSSTAGAAGRVAAELTGTLRSLSAAVSAMGATAQTAAGNYRGADDAIAAGFTSAVPSLFGPSAPTGPFAPTAPLYGPFAPPAPLLGPWP
jgi:hypothetical protein